MTQNHAENQEEEDKVLVTKEAVVDDEESQAEEISSFEHEMDSGS